ncbi:MAG: DUF917 domain-containing protein [Alphaproteobacteria bacterium]|nr:DUF917 domain-containing protein [Alphaproteobacteria bacterium]
MHLPGPLDTEIASRRPAVEPRPPRELTLDDIEALALGAWILGTGGGGDPYNKLLNMRELYRQGRSVTLIDPLSLSDDALVAVLSNMGAPLVGQERLADAAFAVKPVRTMERYLGRAFDAVMSLEIGGGNGVHPLMVAALTGYPVVDADTMGRAYPEAQMTSVAVANLRCYPLTLADIRDNEVIIPRAESWRWMERISRKVCTEVGSIAATCKAPRTGREVKDHAILHTTTKAIDLGRAVMEARVRHRDPVQAILGACDGLTLFTGKVIDVDRRATEGFLRGQARIEGLDRDAGSLFTVHFQNEFSVGYRDGEPVVMTPDLICVVDSVSGDGIGTDVIRYGQRVTVLALPGPEVFMSERGLEAVGPRAFGFDLDFRSVFEGGRS